MSKITLSNSLNPLKLFSESFYVQVILPFLESHARIHAENAAKEQKIIRALDAERQHAWYAHDIKWQWLAAA
jgi:hypothetical protein